MPGFGVAGQPSRRAGESSFFPNIQKLLGTLRKRVHHGHQDQAFEGGGRGLPGQCAVGAAWLKWTGRRTDQGDNPPNEAVESSNGELQSVAGMGVTPAAGEWPLMRAHIAEVLASGDPALGRVDFVVGRLGGTESTGRPRWRWCSAAGKGAGKGAFLTALRALFGSHGLQIYNRAHLVGRRLHV